MQLINHSSKQETMEVLPSCWIKEMSRGHVSTNQAFSPAGAHALLSPGMKLGTTFPEYAHLPPVELTLTVKPQSASSTSAGSLANV